MMFDRGWLVNSFFIRYGVCAFALFIFSCGALSAPKKVLLEEWQGSDESSRTVVDHSPWQAILDQYVVRRKQQTYFDYAVAHQTGFDNLNQYVNSLTAIDPLQLNRQEQFAYWLNLYNAATIQIVLQHYPVKSITKIGKGFFSFGPWKDDILTINQRPISLDDIEHGILRPIYNDPRIHYGVNCASLGCPNLLGTAFTADNINDLLNQGAVDFVNHPRGVAIEESEITLSKIYDWFLEDFGGDVEGLLDHIRQYAHPELLETLSQAANDNTKPGLRYEYDWSLNSP